jgi:hypothetical protein
MVVWYHFSRLGILYQEKSGNPDRGSKILQNNRQHQGDQNGQFYKNYRISPHFYARAFFPSIDHVFILPKWGWATFWATFSQTHLVTLDNTKTTFKLWTICLAFFVDGLETVPKS